MKKSPVEKTFCTTREASTLLGVSVGTIQLWVENGLLEAWRTAGGHRRVLRESIDRLIRSVPSTTLHTHPEETPTHDKPGEGLAAKPLILVMEGDRAVSKLYEEYIPQWEIGFDCVCVDSAMAGLMAIGRKKPEVLIADLQMPHVNMMEIIWFLKMHPDTSALKVIAVTDADVNDVRTEGGLPPGIEIFQKPVPLDILKAAVGLLVAVQTEPVVQT